MFSEVSQKSKNPLNSIFSLMVSTPEFKQSFWEKVGEGEFKQVQCDDVPVPDLEEQENYDQEFCLEGDEEIEIPTGITTYQFNSEMFGTTSKDSVPPKQSTIQFQLTKQLIKIEGYNSRYTSITLISDQLLCLGAGNILLFMRFKNQGFNKFQIFLGHQHEVTDIYYDSKTQCLFSGSSSVHSKPEIIKWRFEGDSSNFNIKQQARYYLPKKSEGVGYIDKIGSTLICIDGLSLHNSNSVYLYNVQDNENYRHISEPIKINGKIIDYSISQFKGTHILTLVTNLGIKIIKNFTQLNKIQKEITTHKFTCVCTHSFNEQKSEPYFLCGTSDGYIWQSQSQKLLGPIHGGWVLKIKTLKIKQNKSDDIYLISSGGDDLTVKIFKIDLKFLKNVLKSDLQSQQLEKASKQAFNFNEANTITLDSYTTKLDIFQEKGNNLLLISCRNGSIIVYNFNQKKVIWKKQMMNNTSPIQAQHHLLTNRLFVPTSELDASKNGTFNSMQILNSQNKSTQSYFNIPLDFSCLCFSIAQTQMIYIVDKKTIEGQQTYPVVIRDIAEFIQSKKVINKPIDFLNSGKIIQKKSSLEVKKSDKKKFMKFLNENSFDQESQQIMKIINIKLNSSQFGKPTIIKYIPEGIIILGTNLGYIILYDISSSQLIVSKQKHQSLVEQIAYQTNILPQQTDKITRFYKSMGGSQLFHWQVITDKEDANKKILVHIGHRTKRLHEIKSCKWDKMLKYSWQIKPIWEKMTTYTDITNILLINQEYLLVSMQTGHLRIYSYPTTKKNIDNYRQFRLFNSKFYLIGHPQKLNFWCIWKGIYLLFKIPS